MSKYVGVIQVLARVGYSFQDQCPRSASQSCLAKAAIRRPHDGQDRA